ncbi:M20 aminoacylase family protein [Serratia rubidaea]|uniref:M20 aminoacylase family protein n=1 Tax=Serratia rubidaea TaxID=61652 RepID=UPI0007744F63|nr:M20 aminoacylase family protein [Serratia rubidaea]AML58637.1 N-acetyl-L,L-diaminopimelate deacetylase [Serratia rubidaea]WBF43340.1 M20 family metallopeptidase [Serratia rubidaea]
MKSNGNYTELADVAPLEEELTALRRHLHQHPELSNVEQQTAALVADKLRQWGYQVTTGIGGYGVVGTLQVGDGGKRLALRADMDALPIEESGDHAYRSRQPGVMHACGHDGHTAMLLGAARYLAQSRSFSGTLHLVFQPAEEVGSNSGAQRMIADGLFERFPCDAIFGMHNHPGYPAGTMMFRSGPFMAACDTITITLHGKGGHAARPHLAVDPLVAASSLVMALQTVVARNIDPTEAAVVTIGSLHAGHAANVIPQSATMELSVRSFNPQVREQLKQRISELAQQHAAGYGARAEVDILPGYPVLINHPQETEFARQVATELLGEQQVVAPFPAIAGSEDFAYYLQQRPGCFMRLGNGDSAMLHNAAYDFNDANLTVGAAYWARLTERFLTA